MNVSAIPRTLQICRLLLAEQRADLADAGGQGYLEILRHHLLAAADAALLLGLAHHALYAFDCLLALLEAPRNLLGEVLDFALLPLLHLLIVEAGEHVLLVQLVELAGLLRDVGEMLGDLVLDVEPSRWQQVHFDDRVAVVLVGTRGHEPLALIGHALAVAEAIGCTAAIACLLSRVVRVRLAVGYKAVQATSATAELGGPLTAYRLVRSRHMVGWQVSKDLYHGRGMSDCSRVLLAGIRLIVARLLWMVLGAARERARDVSWGSAAAVGLLAAPGVWRNRKGPLASSAPRFG